MGDVNGSQASTVDQSGDTRISKRISGLFAVGALPAGLVSAVGDFFGPSGGWLVVGLLGVLAIILAIYLVAYLRQLGGNRLPFWYRLTAGDKELSWIWVGKSPFRSHGIHVVLLFGVMCMLSSAKTYAALEKGGVLAGSVDQIKEAQGLVGISKQIAKSHEEINSNLQQVKEGVAGLKKESSDDPRKELANLGVAWSDKGFLESVRRRDVRAVSLFFRARYSVIDDVVVLNAVNSALASGDPELQRYVRGFSRPVQSHVCIMSLLFGDVYVRHHLPASKEQANWLQELCGDDVRAAVKKNYDQRKEVYDSKMKEFTEWSSLSDSKKRSLHAECTKDLGVGSWFEPQACDRKIPTKPDISILSGSDIVLAWFD